MDAMIDLETLSTRPNAVILSLGAVKFDPFTDLVDVPAGIDVKVDVDQQTEMGRHVQEETINWWSTQPEEVQEQAFGLEDRIKVQDLIKVLNRFLVGVENIWCQGPAFDIVILEDLYRQLECPTPWHFWQIRDSRTLFGVHGDPRDRNRKQAHNALVDCCYQAIGVQEIYKKQSIQPRFVK